MLSQHIALKLTNHFLSEQHIKNEERLYQ